MADQTLTVRVVGDEKDLLRSLRKSTQATQKFSVGLGTVFKGAFAFQAVTRSFDLLGSAISSGISEFSDAQKVAAQTNAAIKSTGGVANVTARHVDALGTSIQNLSGIDDEVVKRGENLILTFKNIRNEAGKGNAIFDRATKAAVNLSVAGFGSIESTSKQLGKALNDPIKGLTALGRAGVTFTQKQKDQVKALVESNHFLQAQKIVLKEVASQVGGSAKALGDTLPGQLSKLREAFRNAFGDLVGAVAKPLGRVLNSFAGFVPKIQEGARRLSDAIGPALDAVVTRWLANAQRLKAVYGSLFDSIRERVLPIARDIAQTLVNAWTNVIAVFERNRERLTRIVDNLGAALVNLWTVARPTIVFLFEKVLPAALNAAIAVLEQLTIAFRRMSEVVVRVVSTIIKALDVFLGGLTKVADAASHLPFVGDHFKGIADKVNASRESLRAFSDELDKIDGRKVTAEVVVLSGGEGRASVTRDPAATAKDQADKANRALQDTEAASKRVTTLATKTTVASTTAKSALEKTRDAFAKMMDALSLSQEKAAATRGLGDDIAAQQRINAAIEREIKLEGRTTALARQLFEGRQALGKLRQQQNQRRQFEALGLTAEGETKVPSVAALSKRLGSLRNQVKGTFLDTAKTRGEFARIANVLAEGPKKVGRTMRQAILQMFNDISSGLDSGKDALKGPLTKTTSINSRKFVAGLGLSPDQERAIAGRLSNFNSAGIGLSGANRTTQTGDFVGGGPIVVQSHVTVTLDGQKVGSAVTRQQQRANRRNPRQKRGPNRHQN